MRALNGENYFMTYSILVVDDDEAVKESVEEYLKIRKYNVNSASSAMEALETLKTFDAALLITDHDSFDYEKIASESNLILDCRNSFGKRNINSDHIVKL